MPSDLVTMGLPVRALSPLYVAIVSFSCFRRFRGMLQLNRKDVAQVELGDVLPMLHFVSKVLLQALFQNVSLVSR